MVGVHVYENSTIVTEPAVVVYLTTSFNSNYIQKKIITPYNFFYCSPCVWKLHHCHRTSCCSLFYYIFQ